jgi:hypothetical protein
MRWLAACYSPSNFERLRQSAADYWTSVCLTGRAGFNEVRHGDRRQGPMMAYDHDFHERETRFPRYFAHFYCRFLPNGVDQQQADYV